MNRETALRLSINAAQLLMRQEHEIIVDGKWGRFTQSVYEKVSPTLRAGIDQMLRAGGTSASELYAMRIEQKARGKVAARISSTVDEALAAASDESGVPLPTLRGFAKIESNFNPRAENGSSRGLMQMQPGAWAAAQGLVKDLPPYKEGVYDPVQNARAGAAYIKLNGIRIGKLGYNEPLTPAVQYLAHQQGAAGFVELWRASKGLAPKGKALVSIAAMRGNPPQDGKGVTTDKAEFFRRWMAVAERKLS